MLNFRALKKPQNKCGCNVFTKLCRHLHKSSDCFECPQKSLVKSSHPNKIHSKLFNTHTKGTEPIIITEVSVLLYYMQYCAFFSDCFSVLNKGRQTFARDPSRVNCAQISHDRELYRVSLGTKLATWANL